MHVKKYYHCAARLSTIDKTEAFVPDHQLTVPEQKSCGKDINGNPFLILCGTFLQKDSHFEINDVGVFSTFCCL
jgi:hypothetical protein